MYFLEPIVVLCGCGLKKDYAEENPLGVPGLLFENANYDRLRLECRRVDVLPNPRVDSGSTL